MVEIVFEFVGGPKDGEVLFGVIGEASDAERYYLCSHRGTIGNRFKVASNYAVETLAEEGLKEDKPHHFQQHHYVVTDRLEDGNQVRVRVQYIPPTNKTNPDLPQ